MNKCILDLIASLRVQSVRGVGSVRGYSYYAYGLYEPCRRADGTWVYKLVGSGERFRSDVNGRTRFAGVPVSATVRHNSTCPDHVVAALENVS